MEGLFPDELGVEGEHAMRPDMPDKFRNLRIALDQLRIALRDATL
jgi:hypothetical protein